MDYKRNAAIFLLLCVFVFFFVLGFRFQAKEEKTTRHTTGLSISRIHFATIPPPAANTAANTTAVLKNADKRPKALLHCTEADREKRLKTVVLTTTNAAFVDITKNMLESIRRTQACANILIIAEDEQSYQRLSPMVQSYPGLRVEKTHLGMSLSDKLAFGTLTYKQFVARRPQYVLRQLERGYDVLFTDADTYWFRDPFRDFEGNFDVAMHNERPNPIFAFCDGFAYYKATSNAIRLVREWVRLLQISNGAKLDQNVLNHLLSTKTVPGLKIRTLDPENYPDGDKFFRTPGWKEKHSNTTVLHLTYIYGADDKTRKLKKFGWWLL